MKQQRFAGAAVVIAGVVLALTCVPTPTQARDSYQRISGEGSSWAANAIDAMRVNVRQFGMTVDYNPSGSSAGRKNYLNGTVDFAASDIPFQFQPEDGSAPENPAPGTYAYIPVVAGGTAFMYNLKINGKRVTNLRLSGQNVARIFTGELTVWNDPALVADNPGLVLPARTIVPVVRSDGSGSSAQFTKWMISQYPQIWNTFCDKSGRAPACGFTSFYPTLPGMIAQGGDLGIAGYVSQGFAEGAIGYVNYSYALGSQFPVAKVLNNAGFYTEPTPQNVAVSLLKAQINTNEADPTVYLTQNLDGVYSDTDPRSYQLSSYSYFILPTVVGGQFNAEKGKTLAAFAYYAMCQAQQQSASLGYSPMPINLVQASFDQIRKIPGAVVQDIDISTCKNPTFAADGSNLLADTAPQPKSCDKQAQVSQCPDGTGGMSNVQTAVKSGGDPAAPTATVQPPTASTAPPAGGGGATGGGATGGGATGGGGTGGGATGGGATGATLPGAVTDSTIAAGDPTLPGDTVQVVPGLGEPGDISVDGCDPDAGCGAQAGVAQVEVGAITTTTLKAEPGSLPLILLNIVLVLGLIVGPPLAWKHFSRKSPA